MIPERSLGIGINTKTLLGSIVVHFHGFALPVIMTLYAEMIVPLRGQYRLTGIGLKYPLGKCYACRNTRTLHLFYSNIRIFVYIIKLRIFGRSYREQNRHKYQK